MVELENIHDDALRMEPIHRVLFGCDGDNLLDEVAAFAAQKGATLAAGPQAQEIVAVYEGKEVTLAIEGSPYKLAVGTLQAFLDWWLLSHPQARLDYIHGEDTVRTLVAGEGAVGFLLPTPERDRLFDTIRTEGALPARRSPWAPPTKSGIIWNAAGCKPFAAGPAVDKVWGAGAFPVAQSFALPSGIPLPFLPAQSSRRALAAPSARFAPSQISAFCALTARSPCICSRLQVALPPSVASAHWAHASFRSACGSLCRLWRQQPTGLTLPFGLPLPFLPAQSSRRALAAPSARFASSQISAFCALAARSPCICSRLQVALPPSVASAHWAHASFRRTCGSLCRLWRQQPTGLTLPFGLPLPFLPAQSSRRALAAPSARFASSQISAFCALAARSPCICSRLQVALPPSVASAHWAHASFRRTCGSLCRLWRQQPTGLTLPFGAPKPSAAAFYVSVASARRAQETRLSPTSGVFNGLAGPALSGRTRLLFSGMPARSRSSGCSAKKSTKKTSDGIDID